MLSAFILFLFAFTLVGLASVWKSKNTKQDYYIASGSVKPWLVGLSAVATNNSGYMFIGVIGYTYTVGLAGIWLMVGWVLGDYLISTLVHKRFNQAAKQTNEVSYAGLLSSWTGSSWTGTKYHLLQRVIGLISLLFLLAYASAQLVAGSKALHVLFDWPLWAGAVLGAVLVTLYCFAGGIRASIWTDAAQSFVMIFAMGMLLFTAVSSLGGISNTLDQMHSIEGFMQWLPSDMAVPGIAGGTIFVLGWVFAGLSVIGQPHVMVRFMTLENSDQMRTARIWYYVWFTVFHSFATGVGLLSRVYLNMDANFDTELALPTMAMELMSPFFVGVVLAGIFAATMSTADSLVLSCSAAITHDLLPRKIEKTLLIKFSTVLITGVALILALSNNQSVFGLVILAWSGLASAFAPLLIMLCLDKRPTERVSLFAIFIGFGIALLWRHFGLHVHFYEGFPGIMSGLIFLVIAEQIWSKTPHKNQHVGSVDET